MHDGQSAFLVQYRRRRRYEEEQDNSIHGECRVRGGCKWQDRAEHSSHCKKNWHPKESADWPHTKKNRNSSYPHRKH